MPPAQSRQERAFAEVEALLAHSSRRYPESLPAFHPERLIPRRPEGDGGTLPAWSDISGAGLDSAVHRLRRVAQDQARAALVSEHLGEMILSPAERERLITRALGILPGSEEELFGELLSEPALAPGRLAEPAALLEACEALGRHYRPASALAYT
ncbi:MAG TPA: hypothetical protein ENN51_08370, partial [candidate division WOR-3 bacterium]|nr:hypothetical protein [candidate division WOR-3 bacterium]